MKIRTCAFQTCMNPSRFAPTIRLFDFKGIIADVGIDLPVCGRCKERITPAKFISHMQWAALEALANKKGKRVPLPGLTEIYFSTIH